MRRTEAMLETDIGYRLAHHEDLTWRPDDPVTEVTDGVVFEEAGVRIVAAPTDHAPVHPTVGYRIEEGGRVGRHRRRHGAVRGPRRALP